MCQRLVSPVHFNLVYACQRCNSVKLNQPIANPLELLAAPSVTFFPDGELVASLSESRRLIRQLDLNSPALIRWRVTWLRIVDLARDRDPSLYRQLIRFPDDLPDLTRLVTVHGPV